MVLENLGGQDEIPIKYKVEKTIKSHNSVKNCLNGKPRHRAQLGMVPSTSVKFHQIPSSSIGELGRTRLNPYIVYSEKNNKVP